MPKIHRHKWPHKGCIGEECDDCLTWNIRCTFDNPYCSQNIFTRDNAIGLALAIVVATLLLIFG
jgi:hypothetical protein